MWDYGREGESWRDVMQVCLNGHVINDGVHKYPQYNKEFCDTCGEKTIQNCPTCNKPIPGEMQDTGVAVIGFSPAAPTYCQSCGSAFPWTDKLSNKRVELDQQKPLQVLQTILSRFHSVAKQLRVRRQDRPTLDIVDEYDVQDLLRCLLAMFFDDIRLEEWTPSYAGKSARMDFLLRAEEVVVEVKMTRKGLSEKDAGDQLLIDIERYKEHPHCKTLLCFIYDPDGRIANPRGLEHDLANQSRGDLKVVVIVHP